ncbi:MAG TPA: SURF1 family protein [Patescibacteria group bacterium]|jgi:surfeit locus 1 family protein|nr:SURF1 family protein [Patescibacteria group bacterium]
MRKPPVMATVLTLVSIAILCGLGTWQVKRLHWKQGILHQLEIAESMNSTPLVTYTDIVARADEDDLKLIRNVSLRGRWLNDREVLLAPRTWQEKIGYHLLTPLALDGGGTVLVNRGWIPEDKKDPASRPETIVNASEVDVMGMLRHPERANIFVPRNAPEKNEWFRIDLAQIATARHIKNLAPLVLYAKLETGNPELPVKEALVWHPPNNHASYAFFWFSMAGILAVVYCFRFLRNKPA